MVLSVAFALFGQDLVALMAKSTEVQDAANEYLIWIVLAPTLGVLAWMMDGVFIGATRTADMRNMMIVSTAVYFAALWLLLDRFGNHGLWAALIIFFVVRGITLAMRYPALEAAADTSS